MSKDKNYIAYPKLNMEFVKALFETYKNNPTDEIREKLILELYPLVEHISKRYEGNPGIDDELLLSYGIEGLIKEIENHNPSKEKTILTSLDNGITYYIAKGISDQYNIGIRIFVTFNFLRRKVENYYGEKIEDNIELLDEILLLMQMQGCITAKKIDEFKFKILSNMLEQKEDKRVLEFEDTTSYMQIFDKDYYTCFVKDAKKLLPRLTERQRKILVTKLGLFGQEPHTFGKLQSIMNAERRTIFDSYSTAIKKIRGCKDILNKYELFTVEEIDPNSLAFGKKKERK